jgi:hypothetical protein
MMQWLGLVLRRLLGWPARGVRGADRISYPFCDVFDLVRGTDQLGAEQLRDTPRLVAAEAISRLSGSVSC